jgi:hypothetical protein
VSGAGPRREAAVSIQAMERRACTWTVAGAAVICVALSACGSSTDSPSTAQGKYAKLDIARVERSIERSIMAQRHLESKVVCPTTVAQRPGKFPCIATTFTAKKPYKKLKTPFVVTVHNTSGYVTYIGR